MDNKVIIAIVAGLLVLGAGYYLLGDGEEVVDESVDIVDEQFDNNLLDENMEEEDVVTMEMTVNLTAVDEDVADQTGTATLSETSEGLIVAVDITPLEVGVEQPAHIHFGECPGVGDIAYSLNPVVNGQSTTVLPITIDELLEQGDLAVNVHESQENLSVYTSCGEL